MDNLNRKVALITGGARGIGKAISLKLAEQGFYIVVNYRSSSNLIDELINEVEKRGSKAVAIQGDVSLFEDAKNIVKEAISAFGRIDVLVNNAGICHIGLFVDMQQKQWDSIIDVNFKGMLNCTHCVLKHMISRKSGSIINISSMWGNVGASCEVIYSASKGGINSFTKALAKELGPSNIRVNAISPGVINTDMNSWLSEEDVNELQQEIPLCKFGECEDIGNTVVFLASDNSKYITGQIITVDGGMV